MNTITIPKNLMNEKDLMIIPRRQYESLLRSSKSKFLKSYSKSDAIYEAQDRDTDEAISIYKKEKNKVN